MTEYDSPWKSTIEFFFRDFLAFFYPQAHKAINWEKGYEFLDKELEKVVRDAKLGRRLVDKLIRVWRQDGEEELVLIHVEVQGQHDSEFAERMYIYNYRVFDRYRRKVASFAILTDNRASWRPNQYYYELWGSRSGLWFPTIKLLDYHERWDFLTHEQNPFAIVVMAHLQAMKTQQDLDHRLSWKIRLVKMLYDKGYQRETVLALFHFIDWVIDLPETKSLEFWQTLTTYEQEKKMPYITSVERIGIQKGIEQGLEQGIKRGIPQGEAKLLTKQLEQRFGPLPQWTIQKLQLASADELEQWGITLLDANTLEDVLK